MTVMEMLRQLFGNRLDEDIVDSKDSTDNKDNNITDNKNNNIDDKMMDNKNKDDNSENIVDTKLTDNIGEDNTMVIFEDGWYDEVSGKINLGKIKNPEVFAAIQKLESKYEKDRNDRDISDALKNELSNYSIRVSSDMISSLIDKSSIKIKDGQVVGVREAIEALKKSEPGLFIEKDKESNPLNEGFNPVEKSGNGIPGTFAEALRLTEEIGN